ncbi:MAG: hypothetical protein JWR13_4527, partial [Mycobacterium sp.]|nr:hypothetical protein [Mycobacterium sp.]
MFATPSQTGRRRPVRAGSVLATSTVMAQATVGTSCGAAALAAAVVTQLPWGVPTVLILAC